MYFVLISSFLLFSLLTGYTGYQGEWVYCAIFGVVSIIILGDGPALSVPIKENIQKRFHLLGLRGLCVSW
ncbi:hypothetical protein ACPJHQ_04130 [Rossellomorea sp. H39__3]